MLTQSDLQKISSIMQAALANHPTKADLKDVLKDYPTKADLKTVFKDYPTKADLKTVLKDYPTKADLSNHPTKGDLSNYPTKDDLNKALNTALKSFVTKEEFKKESRSVQRKLNIIANVFDKEYLGLENRVQKIEYIIMK